MVVEVMLPHMTVALVASVVEHAVVSPGIRSIVVWFGFMLKTMFTFFFACNLNFNHCKQFLSLDCLLLHHGRI